MKIYRIEDILLSISALSVVLIALLHIMALKFFLYWQLPWLDIAMHFLGGFWLAISLLWLLAHVKKGLDFKASVTLSIILVGTIILGIGWEVFELLLGIPRERNFVFDTTTDLVMDLIGGIVALVVANYFSQKFTPTPHGKENPKV